MTGSGVLLTVLLVVASAACGAATWAFIEMARTMRSARILADGLTEKVPPILDKADVTIDAVNAELLRVDGIITRFEDAGERVSSATGTIHDIVNAPTELVSGVASRVRQAWRDRRHGSTAQLQAADAGPGTVPAEQDRKEETETTPQEATDDR